MTTDRTRQVAMIAIGIVTALAAYAGTRYVLGSSQSGEMASRIKAAVDAASPADTLQIYSKPERAEGVSMEDLTSYHYDFDAVERIEKQYLGVPRAEFLREVYAQAVKGHEGGSDNEKWLAVMDYFHRAMRHPPVEIPRYRDRSVVSDPLILLLLHEGQCGYQARVIVDLALANHYEARIVGLAAHVVPEVKWGQAWHCVDADSGIPVESLRSRFAELPSVEALARTPYVLDSFAGRNWEWSDSAHRTLDGMIAPTDAISPYPGELLPSSVYFGKQIFTGVYTGSKSRNGITYSYKKGDIAQWETDRYWGWNDLRTGMQPVPMVPVDYAPLRLTIISPEGVYPDGARAVVPVRWTAQGRPVCDPEKVWDCHLVYDEIGYEVRVSRATRGWDYDFRDYDFMPKSGKGDLLVTREVRRIDATTFGIDVPVPDLPQVYKEHGTSGSEMFIEVVPVALDKAHSSEFMWPSNELRVRVAPRAADLSSLAGGDSVAQLR